MSETIKPFYSKHYEDVSLSFYTKENLRFDLLITCPHAELGNDFIKFDYPSISRLVDLNEKDFDDFLSKIGRAHV